MWETRSSGWRHEIVELVEVEIEVAAERRCRLLAAHRKLLKFGNQERAQKIGVLFADRALGELREKDFALIHYAGENKAILLLGHHVTDELGPQERIEAREDWALRSLADE